MSGKIKDPVPAEFRECIHVLNHNNSRFISAADLRNTIKSINEKLTDDEVDEMIRMASQDGDERIDSKS